MLLRPSGLNRTRLISRTIRAIRHNSTHSHPSPHQVPVQGDGTARIFPLTLILIIALMTPGVLAASIFVGGLYILYLMDRSVAKRNNGWGIIHSWIDRLVPDGCDPQVYSAMIEEQRQGTKAHYELRQPPIYRVNYPEYVLRYITEC
jgi:hypothetical protein